MLYRVRASRRGAQHRTGRPAPPNLAPLQWSHSVDNRPNETHEALCAQQMASLPLVVPKPHVKGRPDQDHIFQGQLFVNWVRKAIVARKHLSRRSSL